MVYYYLIKLKFLIETLLSSFFVNVIVN